MTQNLFGQGWGSWSNEENGSCVSLLYGDEKVGIVASYGNVSSNGITPNDGDTYHRNTFSLRGYANIDRFHLD